MPLCFIRREVTTANINNNNSIIGIHIPNKTKQIKLSQYADDSNFFLKDQESIINVIKFFKTLTKATGTTINLEKTTVLPINTENTSQTQNKTPKTKIKERLDTTKILGVYFHENLKTANKMNCNITLEKMKKLIRCHGCLF